MPSKNAFGVGLRLPIDGDSKYDIGVTQVSGVGCRNMYRMIEGWNPVDAHAAPLNFIESNRRGTIGSQEFRHQRIDPGKQQALQIDVPGMRRVRPAPDPLAPSVHIGSQTLTRAFFEETQNAVTDAWRDESGQFHEHRGVVVAPFAFESIQGRSGRRVVDLNGSKEQIDSGVLCLPGGRTTNRCHTDSK